MVISVFQVVNKLGRFWVFQETFLLVDINMGVILGMFFITLDNADVWFAEKMLIWRTCFTKKALPNIC